MMKTTKANKKLIGLLLIPLAILLNYLSARSMQVTEESYSLGLYKAIAPILSRVTGLYPYSLAELILVLLSFYILWSLIGLVRAFRKAKQAGFRRTGRALLHLLLAGGIVYFSFLLLWGFNYNRTSIADITNLQVRPSSVQELTQLAKSLAKSVNQLRPQVQEDSRGVMQVPGGYTTVLKRASLGYDVISAQIPQLGGSFGPPKPVALSAAMSYTGIWGVYFPFTAEANVNVAIPEPYLAFTAAHEMAHQRGFAREDEANYIAYLTCRAHPDPEFRYSGNLMALVHVLRALAQENPNLQKEITGTLVPGVKRDIIALNEFNSSHESPLETFSLQVNDLYLKANKQKDGDKSYGRVVDLLLAEYRAEN